MGLRREVIELVGGDGGDDSFQCFGLSQADDMQPEAGNEGREGGFFRPRTRADETVNLIALGQQQLCQIGTVLAGDAGDEGAGHERGKGQSAKGRAESAKAEGLELQAAREIGQLAA